MTREPIKHWDGLSDFGRDIREARKLLFPELTIREFAESIGITGPHLTKIELGKVSPPREDVMRKLALKLNIPFQFLFLIAHGRDPDSQCFPFIIRSMDDPLPTFFQLPLVGGSQYLYDYQLSQSEIAKYLGELLLHVSSLLKNKEIEEFDKIGSVTELLRTVLFDSNLELAEARSRAFRAMYFTHNKEQLNDSKGIVD